MADLQMMERCTTFALIPRGDGTALIVGADYKTFALASAIGQLSVGLALCQICPILLAPLAARCTERPQPLEIFARPHKRAHDARKFL